MSVFTNWDVDISDGSAVKRNIYNMNSFFDISVCPFTFPC